MIVTTVTYIIMKRHIMLSGSKMLLLQFTGVTVY